MLSAAPQNKVAGDALLLHHKPDYTGVYYIAGPMCLYRRCLPVVYTAYSESSQKLLFLIEKMCGH